MFKRQFIFLTLVCLLHITTLAIALDNGYQIGTPFTINNNNNSILKAASSNGNTFLVIYIVDYTTLHYTLNSSDQTDH